MTAWERGHLVPDPAGEGRPGAAVGRGRSTTPSAWSGPCATPARCSRRLGTTSREPAGRHVHRGKVRDLYAVGDDRLLMVASDRLSAFDVVMAEPVPDKGRVLTAMSAFWFEQLRDVAPNHLISHRRRRACPPERGDRALAGRMMLVRRCRDAAGRVHRARAPGRARRGRSTGATGTMHGAPAARRAARGRRPARTDVHAFDQGGERRPRREHRVRRRRRAARRRAWPRQARALSLAVYRGRGPRRASAGSSSPTPSSSSACSTASWCWPTRCSRPTRRASGPPRGTSRARRRRGTTSSPCGTGSRPRAGTSGRRRHRCPPRWWPPPGPATSRSTSGSRADPSPTGPARDATAVGGGCGVPPWRA